MLPPLTVAEVLPGEPDEVIPRNLQVPVLVSHPQEISAGLPGYNPHWPAQSPAATDYRQLPAAGTVQQTPPGAAIAGFSAAHGHPAAQSFSAAQGLGLEVSESTKSEFMKPTTRSKGVLGEETTKTISSIPPSPWRGKRSAAEGVVVGKSWLVGLAGFLVALMCLA
jgi:hypothetical protein